MAGSDDETKQLHRERREELMERMPPRSVAVFPAQPAAIRNHDVEHPYRQHSDLFYLTGFEEPETVALLVKGDGSDADRPGDEEGASGKPRFELIVPPRDPHMEKWEGFRAGVEGAVERYGADEAHEVSELGDRLEYALKDAEVLLYAIGDHEAMDRRLLPLLRRFRARKRKGFMGPDRIEDPGPLVHEMRLRKGEAEVARMQRAVDMSVEAHRNAMRAARPGLSERQIQAVLEGTFRARGSARNAYPPIVASGSNATVLHYTENDSPLPDDGLLLIDAGAEYDYYAADITRTFPVSGTFTDPQRAMYEVVLKAQRAAIDVTRPGRTLDEVHETAARALTEGLVELGILSGDVDELLEQGEHKRYFIHRTGHWIGMDVHDVGAYYDREGNSRTLEPGFATTVEPGLYVPSDDEDAPARFRGIGVRIEDDVVVTEGEPLVLSADVPKEPNEIEREMAKPAPYFPGLD